MYFNNSDQTREDFMTRIKTVGLSLKVFSAKLQRLPLPYRIAGCGFLLAVLLGSLLAAGCVKVKVESYVGGPGTLEFDGFVLEAFEMEDVRFDFEPRDQDPSLPTSIQPALAYWLRLGDAIAPRWRTHEWLWQRKDASEKCSFTENTSTTNCKVCDYCNITTACMGVDPNNVSYADPLLSPNVFAYSGFMSAADPQLVLSYNFSSGDVLAACLNSMGRPVGTFEPATSGVYRFESKVWKFKPETDPNEPPGVKIHIVERGLTQKTAYRLTHVGGTNFWKWTIEGDPLWIENFSPSLRVTDIRILKGECGDGSAQGKQCDITIERAPVKPSRITVDGIADYDCYSNPTGSEGRFINLVSCRQMDNTIIEMLVTPTYETLSTNAFEKLAWWVEFNVAGGADADLTTPTPDPMPAGAELIIEFTIQAMP
jgi:hypothetical protein